MAAGYPVEFIIQPHRVLMIFEYQTARRIVYTDGRKLAVADDIDPTFNGDSIGHWEGDTLFTRHLALKPGYELMEFFCDDNNRDFPGKSRLTTP